jgi:Holliday junction resolvase-like predicted endonuclease
MKHHCPEDTAIRFDVVAVEAQQVNWIQNAFDYQ